jgi:hypothetical protein
VRIALARTHEPLLLDLVEAIQHPVRQRLLPGEGLGGQTSVDGIGDTEAEVDHLDRVVGHPLGLLGDGAGDRIAGGIRVVQHEEPVLVALGPREQITDRLDGLAFARGDGEVVALGEASRLPDRVEALLLDIEDLVEDVFRQVVAGDFERAERNRLAGVRLVQAAPCLADQASEWAAVLLVGDEQVLAEVVVLELAARVALSERSNLVVKGSSRDGVGAIA